MSVSDENELSNEGSCGSQISAVAGETQPPVDTVLANSPPTGDPNPKSYSKIIDLPVKLDLGTATFTVNETFTGDDRDALSSFAFTLACDKPEIASIRIPPNNYGWTDQNGTALKPGDTAPRIRYKDPGKQKLNETSPLLSLDVTLQLHKRGEVKVSFNADVTGEEREISKADQDKTLVVKII